MNNTRIVKNRRNIHRWVSFCCIRCVALTAYMSIYNNSQSSDGDACDMLTLENALAIGEVLPNCYNQQECQSQSGVWDAYSKCMNGGIFTGVECKVSGEVSFAGITLKGAYEKGKKYSGSWSLFSCEDKPGNCCIEQGMMVAIS